MLLIKARWFGCKHVAYNLEISIQLGCLKIRIGRLEGSEVFYDETFFLYQKDATRNVAVKADTQKL